MATIPDLLVRYLMLPLLSTGRSRKKLLESLNGARSQLRAAFDDFPAEGRFERVREAELCCAADVVAHIASANFAYREALRRIHDLDEVPVAWEEYRLYAGAEGRNWEDLIEQFERSHTALVAGMNSCVGKNFVCAHPWYGQPTWQHWSALAVLHYGYHVGQLRNFSRVLGTMGETS